MNDIPNFHDGWPTGIQRDAKQVTLSILRVSGEKWRIVMEGVLALRLDGFLEGNIISCFEIIKGSQPAPGILDHLYPAPHPLSEKQYHDIHASGLKKKSSMVMAGEAVMAIITPSYGADFVALGQSIELVGI